MISHCSQELNYKKIERRKEALQWPNAPSRLHVSYTSASAPAGTSDTQLQLPGGTLILLLWYCFRSYHLCSFLISVFLGPFEDWSHLCGDIVRGGTLPVPHSALLRQIQVPQELSRLHCGHPEDFTSPQVTIEHLFLILSTSQETSSHWSVPQTETLWVGQALNVSLYAVWW